MSAAAEARAPAFSPRVVLALVLVGVVSFAGLAVLAAYAPDLRAGQDGRAHALSRSAVGYAGATILMKALGAPVVVGRVRPQRPSESAVVLTPEWGLAPAQLQAYPKGTRTLIVLPKWWAARDPIRPGFVKKAGLMPGGAAFQPLIGGYAKEARIATRKGAGRVTLSGVGGPFDGAGLRTGEIDSLRTISGEGWIPLLVDEQGRAVLAASRRTPSIWVLADPDLLNNQGLKDRDTARVAAAILDAARGGERPVVFDVTLNGLERSRGLGRLMLEPPFLAATLIGVAAAVLMGVHALARFGQPRRRGRAIALGTQALVETSADLIHMARKEHELAPAYAALTGGLIARAAGGRSDPEFLEHLAARRGAASPAELAAEAGKAKTRDDLLAVAQRLYRWREEMTRERR